MTLVGVANYDVVVVGAGAAGLTAAAVAAVEGLRVLLIEKSQVVGGTTAWSGGMVWVPANRKMAALGISDSIDNARLYIDQVWPGEESRTPLAAFLRRADEAITYLETHTPLRLKPVEKYPDYYPDLPGATLGGRVLEPCPFDGRLLGHDFSLLRPPMPDFTLFHGMMISRRDIPHFRKIGRSWASTIRATRLTTRYILERLRASRGTTLHLGNALSGWLFLAVRRLGVELCLETTVTSLTQRHGDISGVVLRDRAGLTRQVDARAVILATGGFPHDPALCTLFMPEPTRHISAAVPTAAGEGIHLGLAAGGQIATTNVSHAFWVPVSRFRHPDGSETLFPHTVTDRSKPGLIAVDRAGKRFVNEAISYHEFGLAMLRHQLSEQVAAFLICDSRFLWRYGLGRIKPFRLSVRRYKMAGYLTSAPTIPELARRLGIDPRLATTISDYNVGARLGTDTQFGRGNDAYQRHLGDGTHQPNPCVAPIEHGPFHAVAIYPASLGTASGLATDESGAVLDVAGNVIAHLYACGNDMNAVMGGSYPGPGITLGPALTFGYLVARHAANSMQHHAASRREDK